MKIYHKIRGELGGDSWIVKRFVKKKNARFFKIHVPVYNINTIKS